MFKMIKVSALNFKSKYVSANRHVIACTKNIAGKTTLGAKTSLLLSFKFIKTNSNEVTEISIKTIFCPPKNSFHTSYQETWLLRTTSLFGRD